jgi:hypothetical protein
MPRCYYHFFYFSSQIFKLALFLLDPPFSEFFLFFLNLCLFFFNLYYLFFTIVFNFIIPNFIEFILFKFLFIIVSNTSLYLSLSLYRVILKVVQIF